MIVIDLTKIADPYCGLGQFCAYLLAELRKLNNPNIIFLTEKEYSLKNLKCHYYHSVHQDAPMPNPFYYFLWKKIKYVLTIHDLNGLHEKKHLKKIFYFIKLQWKILWASGLGFISNASQEDTVRHFYIRKSTKQAIIYNGTNTPRPNNSNKTLNLPNNNYYFFLGTLHPKKNLEVLLPMMCQPTLINTTLVLAGIQIQPYTNKLLQLAQKLNLTHRILFLGPIDENQKEILFTHPLCLGMVNPSLWEGFGLPILEAMHRKTPIYCSNISVYKEIGQDYVEYFEDFSPVSMAQQLSKVISKDKLEKAYHFSQQFSWEKTAQQYCNFYKIL